MKYVDYYDYTVCENGDVYSPFINHKKHVFINECGYYYLNLQINGVAKRWYLHRLLAVLFIPNPLNKPQINHKNGVKTDIRLENLEWCTHQENMQHAYANGLISPHNGGVSPFAKPIVQLDLHGNIIARYPSISSAMRSTGIDKSTIRRQLNKRWVHARKYRWEYAPTTT